MDQADMGSTIRGPHSINKLRLYFLGATRPQQTKEPLFGGYPTSADKGFTICGTQAEQTMLHYSGATGPKQTKPSLFGGKTSPLV